MKPAFPKCTRPEAVKTINVVTGDKSGKTCWDMRSEGNFYCGPNATLFKPKLNLLQRIIECFKYD